LLVAGSLAGGNALQGGTEVVLILLLGEDRAYTGGSLHGSAHH